MDWVCSAASKRLRQRNLPAAVRQRIRSIRRLRHLRNPGIIRTISTRHSGDALTPADARATARMKNRASA